MGFELLLIANYDLFNNPTLIKIVKKQIFSSFFQLKIGYKYFKSYLNRASNFYPDVCFIYNIKENLEHLLLYCKRYSSIRNKLK